MAPTIPVWLRTECAGMFNLIPRVFPYKMEGEKPWERGWGIFLAELPCLLHPSDEPQ